MLEDRRNVEMARRRLLSFGAFILLMMTAVGTSLFFATSASGDSAGGDAFRQLGMLGACALLLIAQIDFEGTRPPMAMPLTLWLLLGYCLLSISWSLVPLISLRRLISFGLTTWVVVRVVGDLGAVRTLSMLRWVLVGLVLASFVAVYFSPLAVHTAVLGDTDTTAGDWRGVFSHKNAAGPVMAMTILLFLFDRRRLPWLICIPVILLSGFFLYKTNSKTSMLVLPPAILVGYLMLYYNPRQRFVVWAGALTALCVGIGFLVSSPSVARMLDDPRAFTGRGRIWHILFEYARENPWFGTGYAAFWQIGPASPVYKLDSGWVAKFVGHGHNGYLDMLVTIGLPGMVLAIFAMLVWPVFKLLSAWQISRSRRAILAAIIFYCAMHNLSESSLLGSTPVQIMLLVAVVLTHHLAAQSEGQHQVLQRRLQQRFPFRGIPGIDFGASRYGPQDVRRQR